MTYHLFRDLLAQRPFKPFRIAMLNGKSYEVRRPDMARVALKGILVAIGNIDDGIPDDCRMCYLDGITAVEPLEAAEVDLQYTGNPS